MGAQLVYLEKPNTEVVTVSGENPKHKTKYMAAEMQGWRLNMVSKSIKGVLYCFQEDAHISNLEFENDKALFAVFDGHGGREVAKYAEKHFPKILLTEDNFHQGDYKEAMRKGFLRVDETLKDGGLSEVAEMKKKLPPAKSPLMKLLND